MLATKKQAHLSDLMRTGKEVAFDAEIDGEEVEIKLWMRKPVSQQHDEAVAKARGAQARRKAEFRDENSDEAIALKDDLEQFETKAQLIEQILRFDQRNLEQQAFNEVLYDENFQPKDEDGNPIWGEQGEEYMELLNALTDRMTEIQEFNEKLGEEDENLIKSFDDDEEIQRLEAQRAELDDAVQARLDELTEGKRQEHERKRFDDLKKDLTKLLVELDANMSWHSVYQKWMLFFTCRMPDDHSKRYFKNIEDIDYLPPFIQQSLINEMDSLDQGIEDTKNLLSLQRS